MAWRRKYRTGEDVRRPDPRPTVRVLRGEDELAAATERAAEHQRRLQDRLEVRARHEAEHGRSAGTREVIRWADTLRRRPVGPPPRSPAA